MADQVSVRGVDLNPIETGLLASPSRVREGLNGSIDLQGCHLSRGYGKEWLVCRRRGNGLGNGFCLGIHAAVVDLWDDPTTQVMDGPGLGMVSIPDIFTRNGH